MAGDRHLAPTVSRSFCVWANCRGWNVNPVVAAARHSERLRTFQPLAKIWPERPRSLQTGRSHNRGQETRHGQIPLPSSSSSASRQTGAQHWRSMWTSCLGGPRSRRLRRGRRIHERSGHNGPASTNRCGHQWGRAVGHDPRHDERVARHSGVGIASMAVSMGEQRIPMPPEASGSMTFPQETRQTRLATRPVSTLPTLDSS